MMTAMIKTPEPHSDSEDSVLLNLHLQLLIHNLYPQYPNFLPTNQKIKSKLLGLKKNSHGRILSYKTSFYLQYVSLLSYKYYSSSN